MYDVLLFPSPLMIINNKLISFPFFSCCAFANVKFSLTILPFFLVLPELFTGIYVVHVKTRFTVHRVNLMLSFILRLYDLCCLFPILSYYTRTTGQSIQRCRGSSTSRSSSTRLLHGPWMSLMARHSLALQLSPSSMDVCQQGMRFDFDTTIIYIYVA